MRICPNDKFIEIFAQRFHYFEIPFYKFFALNLLYQDTSYSLALKYSSFLFKFFSFAFYNIKLFYNFIILSKMKKVSCSFTQQFVCRKCEDIGDGKEEPVEVLCDEVETVKGFCYLGDRLNASGGCETAVTARVRIGWMKFRECGELLLGRRFSLKMKGMVYRSCVRSAMLHGSETGCLRENEMVILRRTERAMVRSMCGVKLVDRKNTEELMKMLGLKETLDKMAKANGVRWYGHVVRRDDESILKKAMMFEVNGPRKRGRPKQTWNKQVEENIKKIGLRVEEATDRARWREGVGAIAEGMRCIQPPSDTRKNRIKTGR